VRMRGYPLADTELAAIAERASALRADTWLAGEELEPRQVAS
jgi:hypothetical protein